MRKEITFSYFNKTRS